MKTFIYLIIILDFTQTVLCKQFCNDTCENLQHMSPNVRRKREYTRWRAQTEKPTEFVVKVFDDYDDVIPPPTKVVTMMPVAPRRTPPKIIVSGITVRVPPRSPEATPVNWAVEYTRFKPLAPNPPKAIPAEGKNILPIAEKPIKNIPKTNIDYGVIKPPKRVDTGRNPQRDESPPAGPHFVPRKPEPAAPRIEASRIQEVPIETPALTPQPPIQYAPVVPVAIVKQQVPNLYPGATAKLQSPTNRYVVFSKYLLSKSTSLKDSIEVDGNSPTRSTKLPSEELYDQRQLDLDEITSNDIVITRIPQAENEELARTTKYDLKSLLGSVVGRFLSRTAAPSEEIVAPTKTVTESTSKKPTTEIYINVYQDYEARRTKGYEFSTVKTIPSTASTASTASTTLEASEAEISASISTIEEPHFVMMESLQTVEEIAITRAASETKDSRRGGDLEYYEDKEVNINPATVRWAYEEIAGNTTNPELIRRAQSKVCNLEDVNPFNFTSVATLNEIYEKLKLWAARSPVTNIIDITQGNLTTMENPIYMLAVDDPSGGQLASAKQTVLIVAGIQGRDHYAVASAMYVLYQLIERSEIHSDVLNKYRFWIIPVFNPDGYEYSRSFANRREWKKNLRQNWETCKDSGSLSETCKPCEEYGIRCYLKPCHGVNLDRNFEYQWIPGHELRAEHPCGDLYAGKRQLSEIETFSLTSYLNELRNQPIFAFIAFKEGDVLGVLYPYSHTKKRRPYDLTYRNRAVAAASSAFSINGRPYVAGQTSEFLPLYAGGIEDWLDGHLGIDNSYAIIMNRPGDTKYTVSMDRVAHEAYAAMDTLLLQKATMNASPKPRGQFAASRRRSGKATTSRINLRVLFIILFINWFS